MLFSLLVLFILNIWKERLQILYSDIMKSSPVVVRVQKLGKLYRGKLLQSNYGTLRDLFSNILRLPFLKSGKTPLQLQEKYFETWALQDVSFEIRQGDVVGIIGRNGAGKSTLLKILSRITRPSKGRVELLGRVGSLLEVGVGFHQELTGRENIFLNGAIIGMKRNEIRKKFDEIVNFAEIDKYLDIPVKRYSSGMYVRLAFAVSAHLDPEILIVDEVLAVGDVNFQKKCLGKMGEVAGAGRTVLFVSHNMGAISRLCNHVIWLDQGRLVNFGETELVIHDYLNSSISSNRLWRNPSGKPNEFGIRYLSASIKQSDSNQIGIVRYDRDFYLELNYRVAEIVRREWAIVFRVSNVSGTVVFTSWDTDFQQSIRKHSVGDFRATCHIPGKFLKPGTYFVSLGTYIPNAKKEFEHFEYIFHFEVSTIGYVMNVQRQGIITPLFEWRIEKSDQNVE